MDPYRLDRLESLLASERWGDACAWTRSKMLEADRSSKVIRALDRAWRGGTKDHFGFSVQVEVVDGPVPDGDDIFVAWDYAKAVGRTVGWLGDVHWRCLAGTSNAAFYPFAEQVPTSGPRSTFPRGCYPFYDVLTEHPDDGFSPRDAYGEWLWSVWCQTWRVSISGT